MEQPQQRAVQVRFNNDSAAAVTLLWHKQMEGGLVVAQEIATIAAGRSRMMRSFSQHAFSVFDGDVELQQWTLSERPRQTYNVSSATAVDPAGKQKKKKKEKEKAQEPAQQAGKEAGKKQQEEAGADSRVLEGGPLVLRNSFIRTFDGVYHQLADANGKAHWASESGMHLYWGPRDMWLLRVRFTPGEPTASAYSHSEHLLASERNPFSWSTPTGGGVASTLSIARHRPAEGAEGEALGAEFAAGSGPRPHAIFADCLVPKFNGTYRLQGQANGRPHWACESDNLHLYWGPQGLWVLRSIFRPGEKACSAYCEGGEEPVGMTRTWHWMRSGSWHAQKLLVQTPPRAEEGAEGGAEEEEEEEEKENAGSEAKEAAGKVSNDDTEMDEAGDGEDAAEEGEEGGAGELGGEAVGWRGEPPVQVGEEGPIVPPAEGSLQTKRRRAEEDDEEEERERESEREAREVKEEAKGEVEMAAKDSERVAQEEQEPAPGPGQQQSSSSSSSSSSAAAASTSSSAAPALPSGPAVINPWGQPAAATAGSGQAQDKAEGTTEHKDQGKPEGTMDEDAPADAVGPASGVEPAGAVGPEAGAALEAGEEEDEGGEGMYEVVVSGGVAVLAKRRRRGGSELDKG